MLHSMLLADSNFPYSLFSKLSSDISSLLRPEPTVKGKMKPITVHITPLEQNSWTPVLLLEHFKIKYELRVSRPEEETQTLFTDTKLIDGTPAIEDPNTGIALSEPAAIVQYIIDQYDTEHRLSYPPTALRERHLCNQWLAFQTSQHSPCLSQWFWLKFLHPEKLTSAIDHYTTEFERILGILDKALEGRDWLVGDKMTFADIAFYWWNEEVQALRGFDKGDGWEDGFQGFCNVRRWHRNIRFASKSPLIGGSKIGMFMSDHGMYPNGMPKGETKSWQEEEEEEYEREVNERYEELIVGYSQRRASSRT